MYFQKNFFFFIFGTCEIVPVVTDRTTEMIEPADYNFAPERRMDLAACKWVASEGKMAVVRILIAVAMESMEHRCMSMVMVERNLAEGVKCTRWVASCTRTQVYCTQVYCTPVYCTMVYCTLVYCTLVYCRPVDCTLVYNSVVVAAVECRCSDTLEQEAVESRPGRCWNFQQSHPSALSFSKE